MELTTYAIPAYILLIISLLVSIVAGVGILVSIYNSVSARSREIVDALMAARKDVCYLEIDAPQGHDAFLIPIPRYLQAFGNYMNRITL